MNPKKTAVILVELQNDFLSESGKLYPLIKPLLDAHHVVNNLVQLIEGAREQDMMIVHAPIQFSPDYREMGNSPYGILQAVKNAGALVRGTWGAEIAPAFPLKQGDILIEGKSTINAFASTNLDFVLRSHGITHVALAGQLTNACVESTMRAAYDKGYDVFGISDATATLGIEEYNNAIRHNWPLFSLPMTHAEFLGKFECLAA